MKKIGFISTNKVLAQSLAALIMEHPDLEFEIYLLLNLNQAVLDADIMGVDVAVVEIVDGTLKEAEAILRICAGLRQTLPGCRVLLLMPPGKTEGSDMMMKAVRTKSVDDYVFCNESLDYLIAKMLYL